MDGQGNEEIPDKMPQFSIILPVFNAHQIIHDAILSIRNQSFGDYELLIMDNESTDDSISLVREFYKEDTRLKIITEKDTGIYDAMNKGICKSTGQWLYFMGADDCFENVDVLQKVKGSILADTDIWYGNIIFSPAGNKESGTWPLEKLITHNINHQRIFYKRNIFDKHTPFDTRYKVAADNELNIRLFCEPQLKKQYADVDVARFNTTGFSANRWDDLFWNNWKQTVKEPFTHHLPASVIYGSLKKYYWHMVLKKEYATAFMLFLKIIFHTDSLSFLKSNLSFVFKKMKRPGKG